MNAKQAQGNRGGRDQANDSNLMPDDHLKVPHEISSSMGRRVYSSGGPLLVHLARTHKTSVVGCTQGRRLRRPSRGQRQIEQSQHARLERRRRT